MSIAIAIDGPAGAGKSSLSKEVAKELSFIYVDTGALYRTIGLAASRKGLKKEDKAEIISMLNDIDVKLSFNDEGTQIVLLNGEDVSSFIRTPEASMFASAVSAIPEVRAFLLDLQRNMAKSDNVIMDGRDIGTVVLPDAKIKIFLTASPEKRAMRRHKENIEKGIDSTYEEVLKDVNQRDYQDSHREIAPLKPAEDSVLVDTSDYDFEGSKELLLRVIKERM
ncbi:MULTISPECIES: (d)CMP kinase [Ruminococcus]|uniref:Cytidylate kinase n=1 Tax=Ruminococcus bovis TaxID=2564099 RepID=A0A4P8XXW3_9FIRM|nr:MULTISPECIES: (d)CMP kinase [Ruminococcus]MEE3438347.1 (d)CMP kinase [Ruminococcus sp.]QCT07917.1 (d)CMP kinase [Ruminococcus bovis]